MLWGLIRIAIFTTAFLVGVFVFGPAGRSSASNVSKADASRETREPIQLKCIDSKIVVVHGAGLLRPTF
jgi:hypothetical protein